MYLWETKLLINPWMCSCQMTKLVSPLHHHVDLSNPKEIPWGTLGWTHTDVENPWFPKGTSLEMVDFHCFSTSVWVYPRVTLFTSPLHHGSGSSSSLASAAASGCRVSGGVVAEAAASMTDSLINHWNTHCHMVVEYKWYTRGDFMGENYNHWKWHLSSITIDEMMKMYQRYHTRRQKFQN